MAVVFMYAVLGGMKGITYTQVAQYCVLIFRLSCPCNLYIDHDYRRAATSAGTWRKPCSMDPGSLYLESSMQLWSTSASRPILRA